ncbi:hypothetical protein TNCV_4159991 [Trichonephila clavipes]|nr:hypothetical protein TNCV_4159991 [Trichonephila clavipes]
MNETTQQEKQLNSAAGTNNSTRQQERNNSTSSVGTKQLNLHCRQPPTTACNRLQPPTTAYDRLQPPATACTAFTAESAFSTYSGSMWTNTMGMY